MDDFTSQKCLEDFSSSGKSFSFYSLPALAKELGVDLRKLPISLRVVLESVLRNCDEKNIFARDVANLVRWDAQKPLQQEIPFIVSRIILQDFTGVPLLVDLAAMRSAVSRMGKNPKMIEPIVPVDLVIDHSLQVDKAGSPQAFAFNMECEMKRNRERYQFLKWGQQAFEKLRIIPPSIGIIHQVNLEYLAKVVNILPLGKNSLVVPDTLVGTDSHTTMINGLGIVGWGVGGIEAEAGMLGQPIYFLTPEVVGVFMSGELQEGVTATDLALAITQLLRKEKVVGKFVEFYGTGAAKLSLPDRATIANMAPEYGATMGFFPVDEETLRYLKLTGRDTDHIELVKNYFQAQEMFGIPTKRDEINYTRVLELDLNSIQPAVAGPKRPQDRILLPQLKQQFTELLEKPVSEGGYGKKQSSNEGLQDGNIVIASITSCTNTSNPSVMLAAGILAKKAVEKGLQVPSFVKASLAPGSRVVTEYLKPFQSYLDQLRFNLVGYGCTTCIGNSGPLDPQIDEALKKHNIIAASVLSGNRNFEARVHPLVKANFLMSPPLVIAFAIAGKVDIDIHSEPLGIGKDKKPVFLKDVWPSSKEIADAAASLDPKIYQKLYKNLDNPEWNKISSPSGVLYEWDSESSYIQEPPFFSEKESSNILDIHHARALAIFGDSVTTDHISPAGNISEKTPAGKYLLEKGISKEDFNSYGARRGNDRVMTRGTFANVRIKNLMVPATEGGITKLFLENEPQVTTIYEAAMAYKEKQIPLIIFGGKEYGTGSSRDWAAKGTKLLGVKAVIAENFERIHRSNLAGMGILPCCFQKDVNAQTLKLDGTEFFSITGLSDELKPLQTLHLEIQRKNSDQVEKIPITLRLDTPIEIEYYRYGGILPFVLKNIVNF